MKEEEEEEEEKKAKTEKKGKKEEWEEEEEEEEEEVKKVKNVIKEEKAKKVKTEEKGKKEEWEEEEEEEVKKVKNVIKEEKVKKVKTEEKGLRRSGRRRSRRRRNPECHKCHQRWWKRFDSPSCGPFSRNKVAIFETMHTTLKADHLYRALQIWRVAQTAAFVLLKISPRPSRPRTAPCGTRRSGVTIERHSARPAGTCGFQPTRDEMNAHSYRRLKPPPGLVRHKIDPWPSSRQGNFPSLTYLQRNAEEVVGERANLRVGERKTSEE
ncbi:unnamed protein product [Nesidiocoris tenuis]|uniref:Uncharacterized protein n=1 Tax=Nesidiocoris tenuis TaxID=355587 RepID=A0A6H5FX93_9HEMI|nr:unnamed protein product [Nesidiocoris tenuis]